MLHATLEEMLNATLEDMTSIYKPTKLEIAAAYHQTLSDIIDVNLKIVFCGINPSLYSAAVSHHFARPGNRFWKTLHAAGFTEKLVSPFDDRLLLKYGYGLTNIVPKATARADELSADELVLGQQALTAKMQQYQPKFLAVLGISAYRVAFNQPKAKMGLQPEAIADTAIWVLPNPSGLNAHYQLDGLKRVYEELRLVAS